MSARGDSATFLQPLLGVLRVRKWIVLQALIVVPLVAVLLSLAQKPRFQASSQVLISRTNLGNVLTGTQDPAAQEFDFNRVVQTQAQLAATPRVAERTLAAAGVTDRTALQFLAQATVVTNPNSDIMTLQVDDQKRATAISLASAFARQFVTYSQALIINQLQQGSRQLNRQLRGLSRRSAAAVQIRSQLQRIANLETLGNSTVSVVQTARTAVQTQPKTARNGILGAVFGLILGIALAFLFDLLDTRLRSSSDIEELLGLPLLARLARPAKALRENDHLAMLADPAGTDADSFRTLRTSLSFADVDHRARTILITSAVQSEGKSTTVANLAVALARAGQHVVLADLDFRRPYLDRFFELPRQPGATTVVLGQAGLEDALTTIPLAGTIPNPPPSNGKGPPGPSAVRTTGRLEVLPPGEIPPNIGEFVTSQALQSLIINLRDRADIVLIDAPPLLQVGDTLSLTANVDALLLVARLGVVRRPMVKEVQRLLSATPVRVLGLIVTDATVEPGAGYGYYYSYGSGDGNGGKASAPQEPTTV